MINLALFGDVISLSVLCIASLTSVSVIYVRKALYVSKSVQTCLILFLSALTDEQFLFELIHNAF